MRGPCACPGPGHGTERGVSTPGGVLGPPGQAQGPRIRSTPPPVPTGRQRPMHLITGLGC